MLICQTPFRVSFAGGGTDVSDFYLHNNGGCVISMAINKYIYLSLHPMFQTSDSLIKYSKIEKVSSLREISHPIVREALMKNNVDGIDLSVSSDIPAGTGLGSSSAFSVAICQILSAYKGIFLNKTSLAEEAAEIEIERVGERIGKQDHYAAAFGGFNFIRFNPDGSTHVEPVFSDPQSADEIVRNCFLVKFGASRSASAVLSAELGTNSINPNKVSLLNAIKESANEGLQHLRKDPLYIAELIRQNWELKKTMSKNTEVDNFISLGISKGATAGKLLGAGNSGFVLFFVPSSTRSVFLDYFGVRAISLGIDYRGSSIIYAN